jgi:hypothetical protein
MSFLIQVMATFHMLPTLAILMPTELTILASVLHQLNPRSKLMMLVSELFSL